MPPARKPIAERFWPKVQKTAGCWQWTAAKTWDGYGFISLGGHRSSVIYAHRFAYETLVGPIPAGMQLDHVCRNRGCVNPAHLEPVTSRENTLRGVSLSAINWVKTHCIRGHAFDEANTYWHPGRSGRLVRACRACHAARARQRYQKVQVAR